MCPPIYDLICSACDISFERFVTNGEPLTCPACGLDKDVRKVPSAFAGYAIKGDNSASTGTPRQFQKREEAH